MSGSFKVAVVGATGAVGRQVLEILTERDFSVGELRLLASDQSDGEFIDFGDDSVLVQTLAKDSFAGIDIAFFCTPAAVSSEFCPVAVRAGAVCIDCSSAWRSDAQVPLVIPDVNPQDMTGFRDKGIVAVSGAASSALATTLKPLHDISPIRRLVITSFQAVSGSGRYGIDELRKQSGELLNGRPCDAKIFPQQIAFNCLPQIGGFLDTGLTEEESNISHELRRLLAVEQLPISVTAVQAPIFYGYSAAVNVENESAISVDQVRNVLTDAPGLQLMDEPGEGIYPTPIEAAGSDLVLVGRLRIDDSRDCALNLWLTADNLRTGAACSAVRIAELLAEQYL